MNNSFLDPQMVGQYHQEYLQLIKFYQNYKRPSIFIKYYNISFDNTSFDENTNAIYDLYTTSELRFDVYDLTPTFIMSPIINNTANVQDMGGQMFESITNCVIYSIKRPRINDIITFYNPIKSEEIYRVTNFKVPLNSLYSVGDSSLFFHELDLEIAPFKDINMLKTSNMFVYDLSEEQYIPKLDYINKINKLEKYNTILSKLTPFYNSVNDLYCVGYQIPLIANQIIYQFKIKFQSNSNRLFEHIYAPYGYDIIPNFDIIETINPECFDDGIYQLYDFDKELLTEYFFMIHNFDPNIYELNLHTLLYWSKQLYDEMIS